MLALDRSAGVILNVTIKRGSFRWAILPTCRTAKRFWRFRWGPWCFRKMALTKDQASQALAKPGDLHKASLTRDVVAFSAA